MRVALKGRGTPIPNVALPDPNIDSNQPSVVLTFTENVDFSTPYYEDLGFTHFEAWCVGAAGGRGGDGTQEVEKVFETTYQSVPQDVWDLRQHYHRVSDYRIRDGEWDHIYAWGDGAGLMTLPQHEEYINPNHVMAFYELTSMSLKHAFDTAIAVGGAGGGGGLHRVTGALAELPSSVPVVVGKVGVDAELGQVRQNGVWTPDGYFFATTVPPGYPAHPPEPSNWDYTQQPIRDYLDQLTNWFWVYTYTNPTPGISFNNPLPGGDGGVSSFGTVCKSSGGQGGGQGSYPISGGSHVPGNGGDGGTGGQLSSGGGGTGSINSGVKGGDGVWLPDTGIGQGGGGGKFNSSGGRGSYSFADTSVYSPGQLGTSLTVGGSNIPGGGGGARLGNLDVGSKAQGFSPDGAVVIRLIKVD